MATSPGNHGKSWSICGIEYCVFPSFYLSHFYISVFCPLFQASITFFIAPVCTTNTFSLTQRRIVRFYARSLWRRYLHDDLVFSKVLLSMWELTSDQGRFPAEIEGVAILGVAMTIKAFRLNRSPSPTMNVTREVCYVFRILNCFWGLRTKCKLMFCWNQSSV